MLERTDAITNEVLDPVTYVLAYLWFWNGLPLIHKFQCMLERTDAITNEVLDPVTFVLAYLWVWNGLPLNT